jgi:hypothetical protein
VDSIIVGFSRPRGWFEPFSWLIRLITWSPMSHAYIRFYDEKLDRWVVFQASGLKVNYIGQTMFDSVEDVVEEFAIPVSDATKQSVLQGAIDVCGSSYGTGQVFGCLWVLFMRIFKKKVNNPFFSGSSYFCSELVGDILEEIGLGDIDPSTMAPKDVRDFLVSKGFKPITQ